MVELSHICCRTVTTSGRCKSCWETRTVKTTMAYMHVPSERVV